jgi:hypothetical protein
LSLPAVYYQSYGKIPEILTKLRDANAPDQLTVQLLKDWGFTSSNDRALVQLLKAIGFLSADGRPTKRYLDYRDHSRSREVLGEALQEAYSDIFLIKNRPTQADAASIQGKFKSFHNASDNTASLMTKTFLGLLSQADIVSKRSSEILEKQSLSEPDPKPNFGVSGKGVLSGLHYNIEIHLPATKDVEVYNAIFKSLKEHFVE